MNPDKSKYSPGPGPKSTTVKVEADEKGVKIDAEIVNADGSPAHAQYDAKFDGKDYPVTGIPYADAVSVKRIDAKETKKTEVASDPKANEKRIAARTKKVSAGLQELQVWLQDLIRTGLSSVQNKPYSFWDGMGARLIDAQAPGAARMVRELAGIPTLCRNSCAAKVKTPILFCGYTTRMTPCLRSLTKRRPALFKFRCAKDSDCP